MLNGIDFFRLFKSTLKTEYCNSVPMRRVGEVKWRVAWTSSSVLDTVCPEKVDILKA